MNWSGRIVARVRGKGKWAGKDIYLIECDDGDRIWRLEDELKKELEVDKSRILQLGMEEYETT